MSTCPQMLGQRCYFSVDQIWSSERHHSEVNFKGLQTKGGSKRPQERNFWGYFCTKKGAVKFSENTHRKSRWHKQPTTVHLPGPDSINSRWPSCPSLCNHVLLSYLLFPWALFWQKRGKRTITLSLSLQASMPGSGPKKKRKSLIMLKFGLLQWTEIFNDWNKNVFVTF